MNYDNVVKVTNMGRGNYGALEIGAVTIVICISNVFAPWYLISLVGVVTAILIKRSPTIKVILATIAATLLTLLINAIGGGNVLGVARLTSALAGIGPSAISFVATLATSISLALVGTFVGTSVSRVLTELTSKNGGANPENASQDNLGSFTTRPVDS
ncbi:MAG: hypothetical protein M0Z45_10140 [Actinomycetota bacterium]|nr:hypothetical protein [Actinomycetota bacterium]